MNKLIKISCLGLIGCGLIAGQALGQTMSHPRTMSKPLFMCTLGKSTLGNPRLHVQQVGGTPIRFFQPRRVDILVANHPRMRVCSSQFRNGRLTVISRPGTTFGRTHGAMIGRPLGGCKVILRNARC